MRRLCANDGRNCERPIVAKKTKIFLPTAPLPDLVAWWNSQNVKGIVIGGLAASLLGRPRITRDLDAMILLEEERWASHAAAGIEFGFEGRISDLLEFAAEARVLLLHHRPTSLDIDIALGRLPFEVEAVSRRRMKTFAGVKIPLPTPEDLIIMKAVAHRDKDLVDIDGVIATQKKLDVPRIRRWVRIFADALETPELYDDMNQRLPAPNKPRPKKKRP